MEYFDQKWKEDKVKYDKEEDNVNDGEDKDEYKEEYKEDDGNKEGQVKKKKKVLLTKNIRQ